MVLATTLLLLDKVLHKIVYKLIEQNSGNHQNKDQFPRSIVCWNQPDQQGCQFSDVPAY